jgi:hypothetical protein
MVTGFTYVNAGAWRACDQKRQADGLAGPGAPRYLSPRRMPPPRGAVFIGVASSP